MAVRCVHVCAYGVSIHLSVYLCMCSLGQSAEWADMGEDIWGCEAACEPAAPMTDFIPSTPFPSITPSTDPHWVGNT